MILISLPSAIVTTLQPLQTNERTGCAFFFKLRYMSTTPHTCPCTNAIIYYELSVCSIRWQFVCANCDCGILHTFAHILYFNIYRAGERAGWQAAGRRLERGALLRCRQKWHIVDTLLLHVRAHVCVCASVIQSEHKLLNSTRWIALI